MPELHLRETSGSGLSLPRAKPPPTSSGIPVPFSYSPSDDGTDENILILLHGLGDTHVPFSKLGRQLKLPQTSTLAIRAPEQIPFLYEDSYQWYPSFDNLGEMIDNPNPTPALDLLTKVVNHLIKDCQWPPNRIHLFGYAQGGSVAAEFAVQRWKKQLQSMSSKTDDLAEPGVTESLGSIISVSGPLLSYPTVSSLCHSPVLVVHRSPPAETALPPNALTYYRKAFQSVTECKLDGKNAGMPSSREEWLPIMRFWSEKLGKRQVESGLYEVMSGGP